MPELPEVETVRRGLVPVMDGAVIAKAVARRPDLRWPLPAQLGARLTGATVRSLRRRSKYILVDLSTDETLLMHLGMSGRLLIQTGADRAQPGRFHHAHPAPSRHDHVLIDMAGGTRIVFNDARRFGAMDLLKTGAEGSHRLLKDLGPEPLSNGFSAAHLGAAFADRRAPVKSLLLDQRIVAGLGNIYVCEALFRAGIAPQRAGGRIGARRLDRLAAMIRAVLEEAIEAGGSSLRDYRQADGELGYFQHRFAVYGRQGEPCQNNRCSGTVVRIVQSGRSSFYCPKCQH
ncbi:MAG: bifunctional DNA-formamidopyrimidine glycosylase/DNA-(apurinic or apyrimidinic site) lyase [Pseudomonadota bacterium]